MTEIEEAFLNWYRQNSLLSIYKEEMSRASFIAGCEYAMKKLLDKKEDKNKEDKKQNM